MDHLTPDVLAAWIDGTLSLSERSAAEAHASDCAHCQAMLAAMARTAPAAPSRGWWSGASMRWLVPVTAGALVIATLVGIDHERHSAAPALKETPVVGSAPAVSAPEVARVEPRATVDEVRNHVETKADKAKKTVTRSAKDAALRDQKQPVSDSIDALRPKRDDGLLPLVGQPFGAVGQSAAPAANAAATPAPPSPSAPPSPPPAVRTPPTETEPLEKPLAVQERVTVTGETPAVAGGRSARAAVAKLAPVEVMSPERSYRWRAVTPGSVQYSMDGGMNWRSSETGTSVTLHAGSAPSRTVCWLVGQSGTVLLTTDGQNWQVRPFPERVDLTDVSATDARNATVTTANQRRFATADGGATWSPLQEN